MKKFLLALLSSLLFVNAHAQIFHENFENPDSVTYSSSGLGNWQQNNRLSTSGSSCDSTSILSPGEYSSMTTISFSTIGYNSVYLYFNQICKLEFFDNGFLEVSIDSGISWFPLTDDMGGPGSNCNYLGLGLFSLQGSRFQEASYGNWQPGNTTSPDNSWWTREIFDLSSILSNVQNAKIRFTASDGNSTGGSGRAGWFIDDIFISDTLDFSLSPFKNRITGSLFVDLNSNQIFDNGEPLIPGQPIGTLTCPWYSFSNTNGNYQFEVYDTVTVTIIPNPYTYSSTYYTVSPATHTATFTGFQQTDSLNDFAFQPNGNYDDMAIDIIANRQFLYPGVNFTYTLLYRNKGTTYQNPTIVLYPDTSINFIGAINPPPSSVTSDSIVWNLTNIPPLFTSKIYISFSVDTLAALTSIFNSYCTILPLTGDFDQSNNMDTAYSGILGSYDPNAITVNLAEIETPQLINLPKLEYTIYFQNTGTDTARFVRINNIIPTELNMNTYELISTSHNVVLNYDTASRQMQYIFYNILLPDSTTNEDESHGYIHYSIRPQTSLIAGDSIRNTADIYFDFNTPVTTNTAITAIVAPTSVTDIQENQEQLFVYPNPAKDELIVHYTSPDEKEMTLEIFNTFGQLMKTIHYSQSGIGTYNLDISDLPDGMFLIRDENAHKNISGKFVKNR